MKKLCFDCGPIAVNHTAEKTHILINWFADFLTFPFDRLWRFIEPVAAPILCDHAAPLALSALTSLGLMERKTEPDGKNPLIIQCLWTEAKRRGIAISEYRFFGRRSDIFVARRGRKMHCFVSIPRPRRDESAALRWMDNKAVLKTRLRKDGVPVSEGRACRTWEAALSVFLKLPKPVIVKPHIGSATRHTTLFIDTEVKLKEAFLKAQQLSPWVMVEEHLAGSVFRATLIGRRLVAVMRRDPPQVIGDGRNTVRALVEKENERPIRQGPIFSRIPFDSYGDAELLRQRLSWESVPQKGRVVSLSQKINWSGGGSTEDVTDSVHPENRTLFERIGALLDDPIVGLDFIVSDIRSPWHRQKPCGIIEASSLPFIDSHHYPFSGKPRNVAGAIWDLIFV